MDVIELKELGFQCCFCRTAIASDQLNPCDLSILINIDKDVTKQSSQFFGCHIGCFKKTIHEAMLPYFAVDDKKNHCKYKEFKTCCNHNQSYAYICYLCYQGIESNEVNPCEINITSNIDKEKTVQYNQSFYFHANCFKPTLHEYMQGYFIFADD